MHWMDPVEWQLILFFVAWAHSSPHLGKKYQVSEIHFKPIQQESSCYHWYLTVS